MSTWRQRFWPTRRRGDDERTRMSVEEFLRTPLRLPQKPPVPREYNRDNAHLHLTGLFYYVDLLIRAQVMRWFLKVASLKSENAWGVPLIDPEEVWAYLHSEKFVVGVPPDDTRVAAERYVAAAIEFRESELRARTDPNDVLPLRQLQKRFGLQANDLDLVLLAALPELDGRYRRLLAYLQDEVELSGVTVESALEILRPVLDARLGPNEMLFDPERPLWTRQVLSLGQPDRGGGGAGGGIGPRTPIHIDEDVVGFLAGRATRHRPLINRRVRELSPRLLPSISLDSLVIDDRLREELGRLAKRFQRPFVDDARANVVDVLHHHAARAAAAPRMPGSIEDAPDLPELTDAMVVLFTGAEGSGRLDAARTLGHDARVPAFVVDLRRAPVEPLEQWRTLVGLCFRTAALAGATMVWSNLDALDEERFTPEYKRVLLDAAGRLPGSTVLIARDAADVPSRIRRHLVIRVAFPLPNVSMRKQLWTDHLPRDGEEFRIEWPSDRREAVAAALADAFQLNKGQIIDAIVTAKGIAVREDAEKPTLRVAHLEAGARRQAGQRLHAFARHISPQPGRTLDDLILPRAARAHLDELLFRITNRSHVQQQLEQAGLRVPPGLLVLFTGASGTGKTMSAEILATLSRVDLYKIDMSMITSKWVGETEKNLAKIFAEATDSNAILFIDEAESVLGTRKEVKDARDRWANQEVNFLLQRIEEFSGVVIMATNLQQNIDPAFARRIHMVVDFPFPDAVDRKRIWLRHLGEPLGNPLHNLSERQIDKLASTFDLAGGNIRNVVVDAGFRAFHRRSEEIEYRHVLVSVARELMKLSRPVTPDAFGADFEYVNKALQGAEPVPPAPPAAPLTPSPQGGARG